MSKFQQIISPNTMPDNNTFIVTFYLWLSGENCFHILDNIKKYRYYIQR